MFAPHRYRNATSQVSDPNFENVSLLLHGDGTNGAQNNTFLDSSTNNFTITRNGTPTQGSFSPYGNSWSNYFTGVNGNYLSIPTNAAFLPAANTDFTIEAWIYRTSSASSGQIVGLAQAFVAADWDFFVDSSSKISFYIGNAALNYSGSTAIPLNTWTHVAVTRFGTSSNNCKLFVNGVIDGQFSYNASLDNTSSSYPLTIGADNTGYQYVFSGYISNIRIVNGTALYTSNFTPPTSPLTAVAGTSLLTCQSNRFIDNSSNNFTITANGTPSVQPNSPFNPTSEYSITANGGSGYFDGVSSLISTKSSALNFEVGNLTIEGWVNPSTIALNQYYCIFSFGTPIQIYIRNSTIEVFFNDSDDSVSYIVNGLTGPLNSISANTWNHFAVVRNGNTFTVYVNGIAGTPATGVTQSIFYSSASPRIGRYDATLYPYFGNISNLRIVNGTAIYTSNFTPPTSPLTAVANTSLLCNFTNAGIFDNAAKNNLLTVGTARVSTAQKKYGSGSMLFNGSTDYLTSFNTNELSFGTGNFTIECWFYANSLSPTSYSALMGFHNSSNTSSWGAYIRSNGVFLYGSGATLLGGGIINTGAWYHFAATRSGNTVRVFLNGVIQSSATVTGAYIDGRFLFRVAEDNEPSNPAFNGYIDDLRITKGIARYIANFTPPTQAFPNL